MTGTAGKGIGLALLACVAVLAFAPSAGAATPRGFWGVLPNYQVTPLDTGDYSSMKKAGVETMRFQFNWNQTEPVRDGTYHWERIDPIMRNLAVRGIEPRPFFYGTPTWIEKSSLHQPSGKAAIAEWKEFLRDVMRRYGRNGRFWQKPGAPPAQPIKAVQILNEVNSSKYYRPRPDPGKYARFIKQSSKAVNAVDRKAKVLLSGMFGTPTSAGAIPAWKFLSRFYKVKGIEKHFDGVAVHPYSPNLRGIRYQMDKMRAVIKKNRDKGTKIYVTEIGWGSAMGSKRSLSKGRSGQAKLLRQSFDLFSDQRRRWNLGGVTWYAWADPASSPDPCIWCKTSGLLDEGGSRKPSWFAYKRATR